MPYEDQLYSGGFPNDMDQSLMEEFQKTEEWKIKHKIISKIGDERYKYFGKRLIYQNKPEVLEKKEYENIHKDIAKKILSVEEAGFTTVPMAESLIDNMRNEKDVSKDKLEYVNDIDAYISEIRKNYEKAI